MAFEAVCYISLNSFIFHSHFYLFFSLSQENVCYVHISPNYEEQMFELIRRVVESYD